MGGRVAELLHPVSGSGDNRPGCAVDHDRPDRHLAAARRGLGHGQSERHGIIHDRRESRLQGRQMSRWACHRQPPAEAPRGFMVSIPVAAQTGRVGAVPTG